MNRWHVALLALVASLWVVSAAAPAAAATCTINGTVALEDLTNVMDINCVGFATDN